MEVEALKGPANSARGNAPGTRVPRPEALKGRAMLDGI